MKEFNILTIFPKILDSYFEQSILARAQKNKLIKINYTDLRDFTNDKHRKVDDKIYGGGPGMLLKIEPLYKAIKFLTKRIRQKQIKTRIILLAANGKPFTQADAKRLTKYERLVIVCGRYEGVDARVEKIIDEKISVGPYVLTGGELAAGLIVDAITRLLPGALGKDESSQDESHSKLGELEYPQYTRPEVFVTAEGKKWRVPKELLSGDHQKIKTWREGKKQTSE